MNVEDPISFYVLEHLVGAARPVDFDLLCPRRRPKTKVNSQAIAGVITPGAANFIGLRCVSGRDSNTRADAAAVRLSTLETNHQPVVSVFSVISQDRGALVEVHDNDVEIAIAIKIAMGRSATRFRARMAAPADPDIS